MPSASLPLSDRVLDQLDEVDARIRAALCARVDLVPAATATLHPLIEEILDCATGGKRVRARLVLMAAGAPTSAALATAAAYELLHAAFVIHDDVIDRDARRRGAPTLHTRGAARYAAEGWSAPDAAHRGHARGIIAGDLALATAYSLIHTAAAEAGEAGPELLRGLDEAVTATTAGELMDVELSLPPGTGPVALGADSAEQVSAAKTAWYTAAAPLAAGGRLAGLAPEAVEALHTAGMHLGTAFQLQDDLLGVFGAPSLTGKAAGADLREGKPTPLLAAALATPQAERLTALLGAVTAPVDGQQAPGREAEIAELTAALEDCGALDAVRARIDRLGSAAVEAVEGAALPPELAAALGDLVADLRERRA